MNCEWVRNNLSAYMDGELNQDSKEMVESHLSGCSECRAALSLLSRAWTALNLWEDEQPPAYLKEAILRSVKSDRYTRLLRALLPVAAVLIIALGIMMFYGRLNDFDKNILVSEKTKGQVSIRAHEGDLEEDDIIANLQIIEEKEFYESFDVLRKIDYLPVMENHDDSRRSMGYFSS